MESDQQLCGQPSARSSRVLPGSTKRRVGPTLAGPPGRAGRAPSSGSGGPESGSSGEASRRRGESESTPQSGAPELWDRSRGASGERRDLPGPERSASEPWPRLPRGPKPGPWALRRGPQGPAVAGREDSRIRNAWWDRSTPFGTQGNTGISIDRPAALVRAPRRVPSRARGGSPGGLRALGEVLSGAPRIDEAEGRSPLDGPSGPSRSGSFERLPRTRFGDLRRGLAAPGRMACRRTD